VGVEWDGIRVSQRGLLLVESGSASVAHLLPLLRDLWCVGDEM
jgi:hypothetical protein